MLCILQTWPIPPPFETSKTFTLTITVTPVSYNRARGTLSSRAQRTNASAKTRWPGTGKQVAGRSGHRHPERAGAAAGVQVSTRSRDLRTEGQRLTLNQCNFFFSCQGLRAMSLLSIGMMAAMLPLCQHGAGRARLPGSPCFW